jgi:hypothetical protein
MASEGIQPVEQHHRQEFIQGMNITLDHQERALLINDELATLKREPNVVLGCGCRIGQIGEARDNEKNMKDKTDVRQSFREAILEVIPRDPEQQKQVLTSGLSIEDFLKIFERLEPPQKFIAGKCLFCREDNLREVKKGRLLPELVDIKSTYCNSCQRSCDNCHRNTCKHHNLPSENPDGTTSLLCPECQVNAGREKLVHRIFKFGALVFTEQKPQQPSKENQDESQA